VNAKNSRPSDGWCFSTLDLTTQGSIPQSPDQILVEKRSAAGKWAHGFAGGSSSSPDGYPSGFFFFGLQEPCPVLPERE
jgi:hypothetical protein